MLMFIIHAYIYILLYEKLTGENTKLKKWLFVFAFGIVRYMAEALPYIDQLQPLVVCTLLILYSLCIRSKNSNMENIGYAFITFSFDGVFQILLGSTLSLVALVIKGLESDWNFVFFISAVSRLVFIFLIVKLEKYFLKIKQSRMLPIVRMVSIMVVVLSLFLDFAFSTGNEKFAYAAMSCIYLAALFTILWLLDHYKMEKLQKMYADDNRQMSQKLHRSKEILPMIANYVSTMDGTQDEEMRKKLEAVCHDYGKELGGAEMSAEFFETTGIDLADLLLRTKIIECGEQDIELNVFVSTQINEDMKRLDISDGEITRLLGDLLRNAINAVSKLQDKMILLLIARNENDCVLIRIYDSGIPFPPYILEHFGERGYTTWGTGNGLADLMDTVTRVHGSIEINMDMDPGDVFTKEIYICFDGKNTINIVKKENAQREIDANVCMET